jgi:hypothetical protein
MSHNARAKTPGAREIYVLLLDGERVFASYSKIHCVAEAGRLIRTGKVGKEMQLIKEYAVKHHKNTILYMWQREKGARWQVVPAVGAI